MADAPLTPVPSAADWGFMLSRGMEGTNSSRDANRLVSALRDSMLGDLLTRPWKDTEYAKAFRLQDATLGSRAAYIAGRALHDLISDGTRTPYWLANHPLGALSLLSAETMEHTGLHPNKKQREVIERELEADNLPTHHEDILERHARKMGFSYRGQHGGIPLDIATGTIPLLASGLMTQLSGNHDLLNFGQGGRSLGYQAILPTEFNNKDTTSVPLELALRYITGRTGRLLPFEEFTVERPDVSREDYDSAKMHQWDKGLLGLGLFKATGRNIEGEPEFTMMGFRVPLSAGAAALGSLGGSVVGAGVGDRFIREQVERRVAAGNALHGPTQAFVKEGPRRLAGALLGALVGGGAGNIGSQVVNDVLIQPAFYPGRVRAEETWPQRRMVELAPPDPAPPPPPPPEDDDVHALQPLPANGALRV